MRKQLLISFLIFLVLIFVTTLVVFYGKGYRFGLDSGKPTVSKTGLLVATSTPDGAQVIINDTLATATDNTIDLTPGKYSIKINKEGYFPWQKEIEVKKELVSKADALLFPQAPKLESITTTGVEAPTIDPSGTKIAFRVASQSATRNGIYVYDMTARAVLSLQTASRQIANDTTDIFSSANLSWTPDGEQVIATVSGQIGPVTYLLSGNQLNETPTDITLTLPTLAVEWESERQESIIAQTASLRPQLKQLINANINIISWSPDDRKILYSAKKDAELPLIIKPRLLGIDLLREQRKVTAGGVYIYDLREDVNTKILEKTPAECSTKDFTCNGHLSWFPDSKHLIHVEDSQIHILESDGQNDTVVYAGPFINGYVYPWPDGSRLIILTNFNNSIILPNLYTISLK